jgi:hypothetical protein
MEEFLARKSGQDRLPFFFSGKNQPATTWLSKKPHGPGRGLCFPPHQTISPIFNGLNHSFPQTNQPRKKQMQSGKNFCPGTMKINVVSPGENHPQISSKIPKKAKFEAKNMSHNLMIRPMLYLLVK